MPRVSTRQLLALFYKDVRQAMREPQMIVVWMIPFVYALLYSLLVIAEQTVLSICLGLSLSLCPIFLQPLLMVTDKESGEQSALLRYGIGLGSILLVKTLLVMLATLFAMALCLFILPFDWRYTLVLMLHALPVLVTFLSLGTLLGFWYNSLQEAVVGKGYSGWMLMFIIILPVIALSSHANWLKSLFNYYPIGLLVAGMNIAQQELAWYKQLPPLGISWLWAITLLGVACWRYGRERSKYKC